MKHMKFFFSTFYAFLMVAIVARAQDFPFFINQGDPRFYKSAKGEWLIRPEKREEVANDMESYPADEDHLGNWGSVTNGLQASLRFAVGFIGSNAPVSTKIIMRNAGKKSCEFSSPDGWESSLVVIDPAGNKLERTNSASAQKSPVWTVDPQMQRKVQMDLRKIFDLKLPGIHEVHGELHARDESDGGFVVATGHTGFMLYNAGMDGDKTDCHYRYFLNLIDGDRFCWDSASGGQVFRWEKVEKSKRDEQCQPAEADVKGNWGATDLGCRVSVRFAKETYSTNEPILSTIIIRDVSASDTRFLFNSPDAPMSVVMAGPKGEILKRKDQQPRNPLAPQNISLRMDEYGLMPQSQRKFEMDLRNLFDLSMPGRYVIYSRPMAYNPTNRHYSEIQSGNAVITITIPPATNFVSPNAPK
jgi:hypothetical protein